MLPVITYRCFVFVFQRKGIWYVFPREPVGESAGLGLMGRDEARRTPYTQFTNNAAHSYGDVSRSRERQCVSARVSECVIG